MPEASSLLGDLDRTLPPGVSAALRRATERDPARRFASVWNLARELLPHASADVQARHATLAASLDATQGGPPRASERGRRGALVALAALAVLISLGWFSRPRSTTPALLRTAPAALTTPRPTDSATFALAVAPDASVIVAQQPTASPSPPVILPARSTVRASRVRPVTRRPSEISSGSPTQDEQEIRPRPDQGTYQHPDGGSIPQ